MPQIEFIKAGFRHADDGIRIVTHGLGLADVSESCARAAIALGYARLPDASAVTLPFSVPPHVIGEVETSPAPRQRRRRSGSA